MVTPLKNILLPKLLGSREASIPPSRNRVEVGFAAMKIRGHVEENGGDLTEPAVYVVFSTRKYSELNKKQSEKLNIF